MKPHNPDTCPVCTDAKIRPNAFDFVLWRGELESDTAWFDRVSQWREEV